MRLSFCLLTTGASGRVAAIVEHMRSVADEVVVAVDELAPEAEVASLQAIADSVHRFTLREPIDAATPWLFSLCSGDWILNTDHDEVPSLALLRALPELLAADDVTHYHLGRRWLWPDTGHYLDEAPWAREAVPKLVRNDSLTMRFSDEFHRPFVFQGPTRFVDHELWHADLLLRPYAFRRDKALAYERSRRGMRVAGVAHNAGFYLPELRPDARTAEVRAEERELIDRVLGAEPPAPPRRPWTPAPVAASAEVDRLWPGGWPYGGRLHRGRVELVEPVARMTASVQQTVDVRVTNESDRVWGYGKDARPEVRLAFRWDGDAPAGGLALRTPFPADLRPGEAQVVPVHVVPPQAPGRHRLEIDLLHEHVRWFGAGVELDIEVVARRRVALLGWGEALADELDRVQLEPEVEPLLVVRREAGELQHWGHPRVTGLCDYLLDGAESLDGRRLLTLLARRTLALVRRARSLRQGEPSRPLPRGAEPFLAELAGCEALVVVGVDWPESAPVVRELWRLAATVRAAAALGLRVEVRPGVLEPFRRPVERALVAAVRRHAAVVPGTMRDPA